MTTWDCLVTRSVQVLGILAPVLSFLIFLCWHWLDQEALLLIRYS